MRRRRHSARWRCWYCDGPLCRSGAAQATVEHLVAVADGGDSAPENVRPACWRCNNFAGRWPVALKVRFRAVVRAVGWAGLEREFGGHAGKIWRAAVEVRLLGLPEPSDAESVAALAHASHVSSGGLTATAARR